MPLMETTTRLHFEVAEKKDLSGQGSHNRETDVHVEYHRGLGGFIGVL